MSASKIISLVCLFTLVFGCTSKKNDSQSESSSFKSVGEIIVLDEQLFQHVSREAKLMVIAEGYDWSEGPLWLPSEKKLIWSDVPQNKIFAWSELDGVTTYLTPSGYTEITPSSKKEGSNGLLLDEKGQLVICQHGDRRMARMDSKISEPSSSFSVITDQFEGKKYNSPNDAAFGPNGNLYFTDPPYGLEDNDSTKELDFQGVFKVNPAGEVSLMTKSLTRPNGIAFNKEKTKCYVANSDPEHAVWMVYDVDENGDLINEQLFFDATAMVEKGNGLPDGLKVNSAGILFATGPGGVFVIAPEGKHLGTFYSGMAIANCALNEDESVLYMTSDSMIIKVDLKE